MTLDTVSDSKAGPSTLTPGITPFHETSQYRNWRYSPNQLALIRAELNAKSVEVFTRNAELEKATQKEMGHDFQAPPPTTYLSVQDELLLLHFYTTQAAAVSRSFGLPEVVESTAISYMKRFYLKNSVMEWHPKTIMPTCLFLAAKTTNFPVPVDVFIKKFSKMTSADILDTEFLVAQSLGFEFWVRGPEKALRGWGLELQAVPVDLTRMIADAKKAPPDANTNAIQAALPKAIEHLHASRMTDLEFTHTPSQISLAAWYLSSESLVMSYLEWKYTNQRTDEEMTEEQTDNLPFGSAKERLMEIVNDVAEIIREAEVNLDMKKVKEVDKRLKGCTNPEKIPGTALYIKRKQEMDRQAEAARSAKIQAKPKDGDIFGEEILRKPLSPRVTVPSPARRPL